MTSTVWPNRRSCSTCWNTKAPEPGLCGLGYMLVTQRILTISIPSNLGTNYQLLVCAVSPFEPSSDPRWHAHHERTVGHVLRHHGAGADDGANTDFDTWQ